MNARSIALLTLLMIASLLVVGLLYVTLPLQQIIAVDYGVEPDRAAWASSAFGLPYAVGFLVWGPLSDRVGREWVLVPGLLATASLTLAVALADTFPALLVARAVQGFVGASVPPVALVMATERLPPASRPLGVALISLAFLAAAPLAQLAATALVSEGLGPIMLGLSAAFSLCALGILGVRQRGGMPPTRVRRDAPRTLTLHRERVVLVAWASAAAALFSYVLFQSGLQRLRTVVPVTPETVQVVTLPALPLSLAAAYLIGRAGPFHTTQLGLAGIIAGLVLASFGSVVAILVGASAMTAGLAVTAPGLIALVVSHAPPAERGLAVAVYAFALYAGAGLAPLTMPSLARGGLPLLCLPSALLCLVALLALSRSSRTEARRITSAPSA